MIPAVLKGEDLINDIRVAHNNPGEVSIWWLGQSGYAIKTASALLYIDLYLSESLSSKYAATDKPHIRMIEAPLRGGDITNATWVLSSHGHTDHFDGETLMPLFGASPNARLVLPAINEENALTMGLARERLRPTRGDETIDLDGITVHIIPSAHPALDYNEATGYPFLGFIIEVDGLTLYHSGDTVLYDGLAERLQQYQPDICFLPINGMRLRDGKPIVAPNLNAREAVALAAQVKPKLVIPHHYDLFSFNTADVGQFADLARAADIPYTILRPGERYWWAKSGNK